MSIDSTELTFVRCPSCRSLVPAAQTKCRMCGASLDTSGADAKGEQHDQDAAKPGRVKQRTMFGGKSELSSAAGQVREESNEPAPVQSSSKQAPVDDPLSAYVEEVDDEVTSAAPYANKKADHVNTAGVNGGAAPEFGAQAEKPRVSEPVKDPGAGKFLAESGAKRSQSGSQLSFSKSKEARPEGRPAAPVQEHQPRAEKVQPEWKDVAPAPQPPARPTAPRQSEHSRVVETGRRRLFGWLVSYSSPDGVATELREGKFFLTRSSLKSSDMIIDNPSISTPHALINVSVKDGFQVQDLMSEQGVFVRRRGEANFERCDTCNINHGDAIKFGEVEYVLSVVAQSGGR